MTPARLRSWGTASLLEGLRSEDPLTQKQSFCSKEGAVGRASTRRPRPAPLFQGNSKQPSKTASHWAAQLSQKPMGVHL
eukprot:CAMPEP_0204191802 /NCGR_PEP_ID=MMETSP0361-20130328/60368_1 /ASSEMBLY_ACC=CAM_ASM_000343 /TAXON_ID=268821 /ORGANISM="Scrippsiella Hangoei, Strain SHTV-5" /LENGTH=78 /DNA_ID=CAMNT_0051152809 /DNA_START=127 /DNA_END=359 /DNA_ORIENTATION=+